MKLSIIVISLLVVFLCSCEDNLGEPKDKVDNAMDYYFPIEDLRETKVYYFKPVQENEPGMYWVLSAHDSLNKTYLTTTVYAGKSVNHVHKIEWLREEVSADSSIMTDYVQYHYTYMGTRSTFRSRIFSPTVFINDLEENTSCTWGFKTAVPDSDYLKEEAKRKRTYTGNATTIDHMDQIEEALIFKDQFIFREINSRSEVVSVEDFYQYSYYAKNIGLFKYKRFIGDSTFEYKLHYIYNMDNQNLPELIKNKHS